MPCARHNRRDRSPTGEPVRCRCRRSNRPGNSQAKGPCGTRTLERDAIRIRRRDNDLRRKDRGGIRGRSQCARVGECRCFQHDDRTAKARPDDVSLNRTPLHELHAGIGGQDGAFRGLRDAGAISDGRACRNICTHARKPGFSMSATWGRCCCHGPSWEAVALGFEALVPMDVLGLAEGRQRYGLFTNDAGGIVDDLMFAQSGRRSVRGGQCGLQGGGHRADARAPAGTDLQVTAADGPRA